jgi:hypothetical protein
MTDYFHEPENIGEAPDAVNITTIIASFQEWKRRNEVRNGNTQDLRKRIEEKYGKLPKGGWTNFKFEAI